MGPREQKEDPTMFGVLASTPVQGSKQANRGHALGGDDQLAFDCLGLR